MNLIWLDDFLALAATGNFSRAAEDRHSSQSAFSRRIRALEEWLGADLFDRTSQPARLTATGEWFVGVAQDMLARVARVPGDAQKIAHAVSSTLRIASTHALSFIFLPKWLLQREQSHADGPVQLMSDSLLRCEALMAQGKVEFVLSHAHPAVPGTLDEASCESALIGHDTLVPVASPDAEGAPCHALQGGGNVPILTYTDESGLGRIITTVLGHALDTLPHRTVFTAQLASVLRSMALDGQGVAWLPRSLVDDDLAHGRLVKAGKVEWDVPVDIRLYRDRQPLGRAAEAFWNDALSRRVQ